MLKVDAFERSSVMAVAAFVFYEIKRNLGAHPRSFNLKWLKVKA